MADAHLTMAAPEDVDWKARSGPVISPGFWRQRNGHTAAIARLKFLEYVIRDERKTFPVWVGRCVECETPCTWNINGTYAAAGRHDFDLMEKIGEFDA